MSERTTQSLYHSKTFSDHQNKQLQKQTLLLPEPGFVASSQHHRRGFRRPGRWQVASGRHVN